jgi:hypothetical protein
VRSLEERVALLRRLYDAFNARDVEAVLAELSDDVVWPNVLEGTTLHGHDAVRTYWERQFAEIDPRVDPVEFTPHDDGSIAVGVHQVVRTLDGEIRSDGHVTHTYTFSGDYVAEMRVSR